MGIKFEERVQALFLFRVIRDFRMSLTNSIPKGSLIMEFVKSIILSEEMRTFSQVKVLVKKREGKARVKSQNL